MVAASSLVGTSWIHGATAATPKGLPLFGFVNTGVGAFPWGAVSLESAINYSTMAGGPHAASSATGAVIAYRTASGHVDTVTQGSTPLPVSTTPTTTTPVTSSTNPGQPPTTSASTTSTTTSTTAPPSTSTTVFLTTSTSAPGVVWNDYTPHNNVPAPAGDPVPFYDPSGNIDLLYVDVTGHLMLLTPNDPVTPLWLHAHRAMAWRPYVTTDLSALTRTVAANGLASVQVSGPNATVAFRTVQNNIEIANLTWEQNQPIPFLNGVPSTVTSALKPVNPPPPPTTTTTRPATTTTTRPPTTTTTRPATTTTPISTVATTTTTRPPPTTTTTTAPPPAPLAFASDPISLPGVVPSFAVLTNQGDLEVFTNIGGPVASWSMFDVTNLTGAAKVQGTLAMGFNSTSLYLAALTSTGSVELFQTSVPSSVFSGHLSTLPTPTWSIQNVTSTTTNAPPLGGALYLSASSNQVTIAGQAANWGDLFVLSAPVGSPNWTATDVSATGGNAARTVGGVITGAQIGSSLTLFAAAVSSSPPQGVGVYAIPNGKWGQAISDGWPIISETGGLGTQSSPWVGFTSATSVSNSPDYLMGQSIYNSHRRVTWLSFWTLSGPLQGESKVGATYYNHGFAAGAWVATQIDQYQSLGVPLKPDWVILDPEGYPDAHSGLDAPGGSSNAVIAKYAGFWSQMMQGWAAGIASVDPNLNAGVYASQSEYRNYGLAAQPLPVFVALAFGGGGPIPVPGASGSNIRGFIAFNATCSPSSALKSQETTLLNPPWGGQFNTLQFNAGVYCPPA